MESSEQEIMVELIGDFADGARIPMKRKDLFLGLKINIPFRHPKTLEPITLQYVVDSLDPPTAR